VSSAFRNLARQLDYEFSDPQLLERALTHSSKSAENNERLEFLGDSVLNLIISAVLYERYSRVGEGELTRVRAGLVKKETLAQLARKLQLGEFLRLGPGELKSGGFARDSILADSLEAIFGAVFLDAGIDCARAVILRLYSELLQSVTPETVIKDSKTQLQEYLQSHALATPVYNVVEVTGKAHNQNFRVECVVPTLEQPVEGVGKSRRAAEQEAATKALKLMTAEGDRV
jgi:ribonuclease-3